ncbi:UPF0149 family protein [Pseudoluteimonas lycopersici]|uniref:UPF0149 family protein n=1 Tax=Pseudoluteimonas lycopersici TaxID=1324796 RepID=A0A516V584_9GAMM|nr:UPF0149 family protein [Lysobacter lycopersici]QDQ73667.1 UPF0149 family protein [Lysobacter lycopersici]
MTNALPSRGDIDEAIRSLGLATTASELQGALLGWLAGGGSADGNWLAAVMADPALPQAASDSPLQRLRDHAVEQLDARNFALDLLVADDDASLADRSGSLFDWCRGFLGGFGLSAGANPPLSEEGGEALADIAKLAAATPQDDGDEEDEAALVEIAEFIRVAALLLHGDCVLGPRHRRSMH